MQGSIFDLMPEQEQEYFRNQAIEEFTPDDWETPDWLAKVMASMLTPKDWRVCELTAGSGNIAKHIPILGTDCIEFKRYRYLKGLSNAPHCNWYNQNALEWNPGYRYDAIVTNLPFSIGLPLLKHGLENLLKPDGRFLLLAPIDYFASVERSKAFRQIDAHIYRKHEIVNRVAYEKEGVPFDERQIYDAIYDIRPGKDEDDRGLKFIYQE